MFNEKIYFERPNQRHVTPKNIFWNKENLNQVKPKKINMLYIWYKKGILGTNKIHVIPYKRL